MAKLIGITCNYDPTDHAGTITGTGIAGQDSMLVAGDYTRCIELAGAVPVIIPLLSDLSKLHTLLDKLDGILVIGGNDVGPELYGERNRYCGTIIPERDQQDMEICRYIVNSTEKPLLAICRGTQILNVALGGTLYQDIEKDADKLKHSGNNYPIYYPWHKVLISDSSRLKTIFHKTEIAVNSYHHQAIAIPGNGLIVSAQSAEDGVIEGIELPGNRFIVGVQWHPEMMLAKASTEWFEEQLSLIRDFVEHC